MTEIKFSLTFSQDFANIKNYLEHQFCNKSAAQSLENELFNKIFLLQNNPEMGTPLRQSIPDLSTEIQNSYRLQVRAYLIIYTYLPSGNSINIDFIFHSKQDHVKLFQQS
jgi:plasmid stabilization system protein ParE